MWGPAFSTFSIISWTPSLWQDSNEFCLGRLRAFELSYSRICCCFVLFFPIFSSILWVPKWCDFPLKLSKCLLGWILTTTPPMAAPLISWGHHTLPCAVWGQSASKVAGPICLELGTRESVTWLSPFGFPWSTCQNHDCILIYNSSGFP